MAKSKKTASATRPPIAKPDAPFATALIVSCGPAFRMDWRRAAFLAQELSDEFPRVRPESLSRLKRDVGELAECAQRLDMPAPIRFENDADGVTWLVGDNNILPFRFRLFERTDWPDLRRAVREALSLFIAKNALNPSPHPTNSATSATIPPEFRTEPISIAEAGVRLGLAPISGTKTKKRDAAGKAARRLMKSGDLRFETLGTKYVFDKRQFPIKK